MIKIVKNDVLDFAFQDGVYILWNIVQRVEKASFWKYLNKLQGKRTDLQNIKKGFHTLLFEGKMEQNVNHLIEIKEDAEMDAGKDTLRLFKVFEQPLLPIELRNEILEKEFR